MQPLDGPCSGGQSVPVHTARLLAPELSVHNKKMTVKKKEKMFL